MGERRTRQDILPSLLDRLTDDEPRNRTEGEVSRGQALRDLKAGIRRDIEWLLNTRRRITEVPAGSVQLPESLFVYGLPDLTGYALNTERDQSELVCLIEQVIATFEPRLRTVIVSMQPITAAARVIRFQVEGILRVEPGPERIQFDTLLELTSGTYKVEGGPGAQ
ncbi:type VI secretion system baseplate subunit TssE [uncultured Paludibaculum sp.]|uniref:type VI secretion system baseplate subunit TssE n=1 Tax=uncultured Paludibaculum sp. TaxID=1765020 RepID=UPI002AAC025B|nr:type VI secretion system baseplate subunit TssE [uncultured Paludibaculum sp.]